MTADDLTELDQWALLIGRNVMRFATTCECMRHANPACSTMYVEPDTTTPYGIATAATIDFIEWCANGTFDSKQSERFRAFCRSLGETPAAAVAQLKLPEAVA